LTFARRLWQSHKLLQINFCAVYGPRRTHGWSGELGKNWTFLCVRMQLELEQCSMSSIWSVRPQKAKNILHLTRKVVLLAHNKHTRYWRDELRRRRAAERRTVTAGAIQARQRAAQAPLLVPTARRALLSRALLINAITIKTTPTIESRLALSHSLVCSRRHSRIRPICL
jgi:hypothetical protein